MPNPKRRHSNSRTRKRRTHWKLSRPTFNECSNCGQQKLPHRICATCGHYDGREIIKTEGI